MKKKKLKPSPGKIVWADIRFDVVFLLDAWLIEYTLLGPHGNFDGNAAIHYVLSLHYLNINMNTDILSYFELRKNGNLDSKSSISELLNPKINVWFLRTKDAEFVKSSIVAILLMTSTSESKVSIQPDSPPSLSSMFNLKS